MLQLTMMEKRKTGCAKCFELPVDVLVPGARPNVITGNEMLRRSGGKIVVGATVSDDRKVEKNSQTAGVLVFPDFACKCRKSYLNVTNGREANEKEMFKGS